MFRPTGKNTNESEVIKSHIGRGRKKVAVGVEVGLRERERGREREGERWDGREKGYSFITAM